MPQHNLVKFTDAWGQSHFVDVEELHQNSIPLRFSTGRPYAEMAVVFRPNLCTINKNSLQEYLTTTL